MCEGLLEDPEDLVLCSGCSTYAGDFGVCECILIVEPPGQTVITNIIGCTECNVFVNTHGECLCVRFVD